MDRNKTPLPIITAEHIEYMKNCVYDGTCSCSERFPDGMMMCPLSGNEPAGCAIRYGAKRVDKDILPFFKDLIAANDRTIEDISED